MRMDSRRSRLSLPRCVRRCCSAFAVLVAVVVLWAPPARAQEVSGDLPEGGGNASIDAARGAPQSRTDLSAGTSPSVAGSLSNSLSQVPDLTKRENFSAALQLLILLTVLSLAPAIL